MLKVSQLKLNVSIPEEEHAVILVKKLSKLLSVPELDIFDLRIIKRSIDARKKPELFYSFTAAFSVKNEESVLSRAFRKKELAQRIEKYNEKEYVFPYSASLKPDDLFLDEKNRPVIIGSGPAGLFCGLFLARAGFKPIIHERGKDVDERTKTVEGFWNGERLLPDCNVQFGEGGAGTFSDGKLNTLIKDPLGLNKIVLKTFFEHGAPEKILYDSKPHVGTDILKGVVKSIREEIISLGGEVFFDSKVSEILFDNGCVSGYRVGERVFPAKNIVLAIGHSARDTFYMLYDNGVYMEQKPFATGFRVMHDQRKINLSQYGKEDCLGLGSADYKLTAKTDCGRGVFSFCMCPGGYVVNASSEDGMTAVNGMSYSGRDSGCANSAIIFTVDPSDYASDHPLAGVEFQRNIEKKAYELGKGNIPVQEYSGFKMSVLKGDEISNSSGGFSKGAFSYDVKLKGAYSFADMSGIYTDEMNKAFIQGMEHFEKIIPGFASGEVLMAGVESRTSSPVRIVRNEEFQSNYSGLFPCGEGAGYAGGITSAAMDGIKVAENVAKKVLGV